MWLLPLPRRYFAGFSIFARLRPKYRKKGFLPAITLYISVPDPFRRLVAVSEVARVVPERNRIEKMEDR